MPMGIGLGIGVTRGGGVGVYQFTDADAEAYVAAMTTQPTNARKAAIDASFTRMKARTYWPKLDWLSFPASHDTQAGRINQKNPAQIAAVTGSPTFVADQGFYSNISGVGGLNTGVNPATAGGAFTQNSAHMGVWNFTDYANNGAIKEMEAGNAQIWSHYAPYFYCRANAGGLLQIQPIDGVALGHRAWSRTGNLATALFSDGIKVLTDTTTASAAVSSANVVSASPRGVMAMHFGGGLSDAEMAELRDDIGAYFNDAMILPIFDVFLIIGDSNNTAGVGFDAEIDTPDAAVWGNLSGPKKSVAVDGFMADNAAYPVPFAKDFYKPGALQPGHAVVVLNAWAGGTGLTTSGNSWQAPSGAAYVAALRQIRVILRSMPNANPAGILGIIGANDATLSANAATWQAALDAMIAGFRSNITGGSNVPVVIGGIPPEYLDTGTAAALQAEIADLPSRLTYTGYADPSSPTVINDNADDIHYTAIGQRGTLGNPGGMAGRFWTGYQQALANEP